MRQPMPLNNNNVLMVQALNHMKEVEITFTCKQSGSIDYARNQHTPLRYYYIPLQYSDCSAPYLCCVIC